MQRTFLQLSAFFGLFAVALGAIAKHALQPRLSPQALEIFDTAARYQMYHALALGLVAALAGRIADKRLNTAGWLFTVGIVIFSGSLYALALTDVKILGAITPLGGLAFMVAWGLLFLVGRSLTVPTTPTP